MLNQSAKPSDQALFYVPVFQRVDYIKNIYEQVKISFQIYCIESSGCLVPHHK